MRRRRWLRAKPTFSPGRASFPARPVPLLERPEQMRGHDKKFHHILARQAMNIFTKSIATLTLAAIGILGFQSQAQAQFRPIVRPYTGQIQQIPSVQQTFPVNPNWLVAPGVNTQQYLYNQAVQA